MAGLTDAYELTALDTLFTTGDKVQLSTNGTSEIDGSGNGYDATAVTWAAAASGAKSNSAAVSFPLATASWGSVTHFRVTDSTEATVKTDFTALASAKTIPTGDGLTFAIGSLSITAD